MRPTNSYTDAPQLHPNIIFASLQLFTWLVFHPAAWRNLVAQIDPEIHPGISFSELKWRFIRKPIIRRIILIEYLIWPICTSMIMGIILWGLGYTPNRIIFGLIFGVMLGISAGITYGFIGGFAAGGFAIIVCNVIGSFFGVIVVEIVRLISIGALLTTSNIDPRSLLDTIASEIAFTSASHAAAGIAIGLGAGIIGSIIVNMASQKKAMFSLSRLIGGIVIGVVVCEGAYGLTFGLSIGMGNLLKGGLAGIVISASTFGLAYGTSVGVRLKNWQTGIVSGIIFGLFSSLAFGLTGAITGDLQNNLFFASVSGLGIGLWLGAYFTLPFVLAEIIAGNWAGAIAGSLGGGGVYLFFLFAINSPDFIPIALGVILCIFLGITFSWWRSILFFPLFTAWNLILFKADEQSTSLPRLLHLNSAFWDEFQRLPLLGLDEHLLLMMEKNPVEGRIALEYIASSHQRWASRATQIEMDARKLECCVTIDNISQVHKSLGTEELEGSTSRVIRSLNRLSQDIEISLRQESIYNQRLSLNNIEDRFDKLLQELMRTPDRQTIRFRPIAISWQLIVHNYIKELKEIAESRQEIESPYVIGIPLTEREEIFIGRTDIIMHLEHLLLDKRCPPLMLYGQRRTGKTSLLNNLSRLMPSTIIPMFVDLQGPVSRSSDHIGFLYNLAQNMSNSALKNRKLELPKLSRESLAEDPFSVFEVWLDQLEDRLDNCQALLMLDEFESLDDAFKDSRFNEAAILGMFRHWIQHRSRFKILLAGAHTIYELHHWASYLVNVQVLKIGYLAESEARKLIEYPIKDFALKYEPEASLRVLALTRGHPFLVQLLCAEIIVLKNEQEPSLRRLASLKDVEDAVPSALLHGSFFFADIERNQVDLIGCNVLKFIALQGEGQVVTTDQLSIFATGPGLLDDILSILLRRDLIEARGNGFIFQVELIRQWFAKNNYDLSFG